MFGLRPLRPNMPPTGRPPFRPPNVPRPRTEAYYIKKLRRKTRRRSLRRKSKDGSPLSSFFDRLPDDANDRILQLCSNKPRSPNWKGFVNPRIVVKWLKDGGALADCIRRTFDQLELSSKLPQERDGIFMYGRNESVVQNFCHILNGIGSSLTNIRVCHPSFPKLWRNALLNNCPNIKKLALTAPQPHGDIAQYPLSDILCACSGSLESLELGWYSLRSSDIQAMRMHCIGIKSLSFSFRDGMHNIEPLWRSVGLSLEQLSLRSPCSYYGSNYQIPAVEKHCKELIKLTLANIPRMYHPQITQLCVSLGAQLESLTLEHCNMRAHCLGIIASACSNVCVDIYEVRGCSLEAILALGSRAARVTIGQELTGAAFGAPNENRLQTVSEKCVNLVGLSICADALITPEAFQALFYRPKKLFRDFKWISRLSLRTDIIEVLASKVTTLVNFEYKGSKIPLFVFHKLLDTNPMLRKVHVEASGDCLCWKSAIPWHFESIPNWSHVAEKLIQCPNLREVDLSCTGRPAPPPKHRCMVEEFQQACYPARERDISIRICGYQYL